MRLTGLQLTNVRAIESAELSFSPGLNLIAGVNGVGKTTVLDVICICLSRLLPSISPSRSRAVTFSTEDIRIGFPFLDVSLTAKMDQQDMRFTRLQWRESFATDDEENLNRLRREIMESERLRDRARNLLRDLDTSNAVSDSDTFFPSEAELRQAAKGVKAAPLGVFFATNRSVVSGARAPQARAIGGEAAAYAESLSARPWRIRELAEWMRAQESLAEEIPLAKRHLAILERTAALFLTGYKGLRLDEEDPSRVLIDSKVGTLDARQLSDGERGVLGMVLDLARRLSQANPELDDPVRDAEAIVLIDELDLHLHPAWQRRIVHTLTDVFPQCQFIATTHSPQIIGEVEHEQIHIIEDGKVYSPPHSFGVDSSRVLEEIMDANPRTKAVGAMLSQVAQAIGQQEYALAHELVSKISNRPGDDDPEVTRLRILLDFMEGKE